jgi:hypothetical protein
LASLDTIIETQKTLEQKSQNQELEALREQVKVLSSKVRERKSSIMQPTQKRVTRSVSVIKQEGLEKKETKAPEPVPVAEPVTTPEPVSITEVGRRRSTARSSIILPPQIRGDVSLSSTAVAEEENKTGSEILQAANKNGFLSKEGDRFKTWHRRWFRIVKEDNLYVLAYFQNLGDLKAIKSIPLQNAVIQLATEKENGTSRLCCFKIKTNTRIFYLNASSENDRTEWMKALNIVVNLK